MKTLKAMAIIEEQGKLTLDQPLLTDENSRVEVIVLISESSEVKEEEQFKSALLHDFRQAWHEAMIGQTILVAQLWKELESD